MSILLSIAAIIGIAVTLASSLQPEKKATLRRLAIIGALVAIFAVVAEFVTKKQDGAEHKRELAAAKQRHEQLKEQNDSLYTEMRTLTVASQEMKGMLDPVLKMARDKNPGSDDKEAFKTLLKDMNEIMNPKLVFLEDRTITKRVDETGQYVTTYVWRSKYPVAIRDVSAKVRFDCVVLKAQHVLNNPFMQSDSLLNINQDRKGVTYYKRQLGADSDMILHVFTETPPKIVSSELSP